jgi:hypothetical protein
MIPNMGAWSAEPFGNDSAADWAWELDDSTDWQVVEDAFREVLDVGDAIDADVASNAIGAAETVAQGLGRATQDDSFTESVGAFVARVSRPGAETVRLALAALAAATGPTSELTELWEDSGREEWDRANARIAAALTAS